MCDTLVSLRTATARGALLFAKNSDRERNEAQALELRPTARHPADTKVRLTYITIPQAERTHACLLSRPFWMWGAEMGANDQGVVIGNEALHAVRPAQRTPALTGMDLVRLGLERADTAAEAVSVITALLERHGQGGDCGHLGRFYYHNGFIVADPEEAFVLETVGRDWVVQRVASVRALSNAYSISRDHDAISPTLARHAEAAGGDVAAHLLDTARDAVSFGRVRCARGTELLARREGSLTPADMRAILRDHGDTPDWSPANTPTRTICMHAASGARRSQSVASMVSELTDGRHVHWVTGTSAPCTSVFKPFVFGAALPPHGPTPIDRFDEDTLWWRHERLHRAMLRDFAASQAMIAEERDTLEADFQVRIDSAADGPSLKAAIVSCWRDAETAEARWRSALGRLARDHNPIGYQRSWARLNHVAGLPRS